MKGILMFLLTTAAVLLGGDYRLTVDSRVDSYVLFDLFIPGAPEGADIVEAEETEEPDRPEIGLNALTRSAGPAKSRTHRAEPIPGRHKGHTST